MEAWLQANKPGLSLSAEGKLWHAIKALGDDLRLAQVLCATGAFLAVVRQGAWQRLAKLDDEKLEATVPAEVRKACQSAAVFPSKLPPGTGPLLRDLASLAGELGEAQLFEYFTTRFLEAQHRSFAATPPPLAKFVADLVGERPRTLLDPACGTGTLLLAASDQHRRLLGQERDTDLAQVAAIRLALSAEQAVVVGGDSLHADGFGGELVDAVVCHPPFNERDWGHEELAADPRWEYGLPPRMESELAWVQHGLAHVKPGGIVVTLMPVTAANRRSGRRIRANLVRKGALRGVVDLPPSMASTAGIPAHLWLLTRPVPGSPPPATVWFASAVKDRPAELASAWVAYLREPTAEPSSGRTVATIDLLDEDVDLTPDRYLAEGGGDQVTVQSLTDEINDLLGRVRRLLPAQPEPLAVSLTTAGELAQAGILEIIRPGREEQAWSEAGDIVVTPGTDRLDVEVTRRPTLVTARNHLIRIHRRDVDPEFIAGFLRSAHNPVPSSGTSSGMRRDVRKAVVPRLPAIETQRAYGEVFRRLEELRVVLNEAAAKGERLTRLVLDEITRDARP
ncbi:N-6 DNA methylase [Thermoactinospora rubra]|uniref:N-6 DNA methylase n=1 Tax=Thermoactinospora rubra TaxID=1088767 RepID=UPI001301A4B9|nr:N-6 DNA methylase [Thermoactinospora rubra]